MLAEPASREARSESHRVRDEENGAPRPEPEPLVPSIVSQLPFATPNEFSPAPDISEPHPLTGLWITMRDREVLLASSQKTVLPATPPVMDFTAVQYLGTLGDVPVMAAAVPRDTEAPSDWSWVALRSLFGVLDDAHFSLCGRAAQLLDWELCHAFCGRCGTRTQRDGKERCMRCSQCGLSVFPRIEPAIIVAVTRPPNGILLAHADRLPRGMHSVLAGFVEPGESLEQCVAREVFEETGIRVGNIQYVASQPWPFPRALMVGFVAEYVSGSIVIDPHELQGAEWFDWDHLPPLPSHLSIARHLIEYAKAQALHG